MVVAAVAKVVVHRPLSDSDEVRPVWEKVVVLVAFAGVPVAGCSGAKVAAG